MSDSELNGKRNAGERCEKDEAYWTILSAAMELDFKKGHLKWTLSELSRKTEITRSLIYYYFGRSKEEILQEAVKLIGEEMVGLTEARSKMWAEGRFEESMLLARSIFDKAPYIGPFMLVHRNKPTELGKELLAIENQFFEKLRLFFKGAKEDELQALFCMYWGMLFCPRATTEAIHVLISAMQKGIHASKKRNS